MSERELLQAERIDNLVNEANIATRRLDALEGRLDHFTPLLAGETGKLETVVACLQCNQDDTGSAYESLSERLDALEGKPQEAGTSPADEEMISCEEANRRIRENDFGKPALAAIEGAPREKGEGK